jgi:hypothetical protein
VINVNAATATIPNATIINTFAIHFPRFILLLF